MPGKSSLSTKSQSSKKDADTAPAKKKILIWPEWNEAEIAAEKFDTGSKGKDRGKVSVSAGALYEDPDGQPRLPPCLSGRIDSWKRPTDYLQHDVPVIVSDKDNIDIDLVTPNEHLLSSKLMCTVISELQSLIYVHASLPQMTPEPDHPPIPWKPWNHINPWPKGMSTPSFNPQGKYCIKLYWMGCWRKITVDDRFPMDVNDTVLLPVTSIPGELWPLLLTKAILKVINLECVNDDCEIKDFSITELLTGWVCEHINLKGMSETWDMILTGLPQWIRPVDNETETESNSERNCIILGTLPSNSAAESMKGFGLSVTDPTHPILLTQWKDEPLELPPKEPPLPTLETPYYLGLKNRSHRPGTKTPPPIKTDFRSFKLYSPFVTSTDKFIWLDLDDFVSIFQEVCFYWKQSYFEFNQTTSDLSSTVPNSAITATAPKKGVASSSQMFTKLLNSVVDNCNPVSLLINFSSISCWYEGGTVLGNISLPSVSNNSLAIEEANNRDDIAIIPGSLIVEIYNWKQFNGANNPLMRLRTAGSKAISLHLDKGRNVLKLHMTAPFGYHLSVYSQTNFSLTNEDGVLSLLTSPSERCIKYSHILFEKLLELAGHISNDELLYQSILELYNSHIPHGVHIHAIRAAVIITVHVLGIHYGLTSAHVFGWKSFINQTMAKLAGLSINDQEYIPQMKFAEMKNFKFEGVTISDEQLQELEKELNTADIDNIPQAEVTDNICPTSDVASTDISQTTSGELKRVNDGSDEIDEEEKETEITQDEEKVKLAELEREKAKEREESLLSSIPLLQPHVTILGQAVLSSLFTLCPDLLNKFSFSTDELSRVYHKVYGVGAVPQLDTNKWTLLFRDEFNVSIPQVIAFRFHCPIKTSLIKLVNNDTGHETVCGLPSSISSTIEPNELGYTLLGEMWTYKESIEAGDKLSLTLISSSPNLPLFNKSDGDKLTTEFHTIVNRNYYLPDRDFIILRYVAKVTAQCHVTIQVSTSKQDAIFKLEVLDKGVAIICREGCGHCVIPSLTLLASNDTEQHHYVIKATALYDSWTVAESSWSYISMIKNMEKEGKPSSGKKTKGRDKGTKTPKAAGNLPQSSPDGLDTTKPHWTLRVVTNTESTSSLQVVKDTEREDTLNEMIKQWDKEDPGRSQKALQSRQKFLEAYAATKEESAPEEGSSDVGRVASSTGNTSSGIPLFGPVPLKPIDLSPYIIDIPDGVDVQYMDQTLEKEREKVQQEKLQEYNEWKRIVMESREQDYMKRNNLKKEQLSKARKIQVVLNDTRNKLNSPREEIREKFLEAERIKQEAIAAEKAREELPQSGDMKKGKSPKGKKK